MPKLNQVVKELQGQIVMIRCAGGIYIGEIVDANEDFIHMIKAKVMLERGHFNDPEWLTKCEIPDNGGRDWYIQTDKIESAGLFE